MALFRKKTSRVAGAVDMDRLPRHIAVIMDGNGRWAKKRALPRSAGHAAGAERFRDIATYCRDLGVGYFTVYAFSTENWKRSVDEVEAIMRLLEQYLHEAVDTMKRDNIRLRFLGDTTILSDTLRRLIAQTEEASEKNDGMLACICLNYGGRGEILRAARMFAEECAAGRRKPEELSEKIFSGLLYSEGIPDPDLIIRPSGEIRTSNFLLWQSAYAEYYFCDTLWPDFSRKEMDRAIIAYQGRSRRFGGREERK